jgi:hypothetical protein
MLLILEIVMLICGIVVLITGKFSLTRTKVVRGAVARIIGGVMILPLPLALGAALLIGVVLGASGRVPDMDKFKMFGTIMELAIVLICFVTAMVIAGVYAKPSPPERRRRRRDEDEEEYDREEDDRTEIDEDRPRRRDDQIRRPRGDRSRE